ncbi:hypothetical protein OL233_08190 [Vagococcus sp. PNs007]|uniref:Uncharacterized protein n=1 Tax=Vagococcus proximus TaxID=2991417 RepID=A0ABT5X2M7_9ENTE|nr:hypothetical protein [Vagococcus proximus]MDF0480261.1 hypothetical protein [Vagococcus proximus]
MTFIVFMRGFEVFEETQKGNAKDNVNKNFYALLDLIQKERTALKGNEPYRITNTMSNVNIFDFLDDTIHKNSVTPIYFENFTLNNFVNTKDQAGLYFGLLEQIVSYLNSNYLNKTISSSDYDLYINILGSTLSIKELNIILTYAIYIPNGFNLSVSLIGTGLFYTKSSDRKYTICLKELEDISDEYMPRISPEKASELREYVVRNNIEYKNNNPNTFHYSANLKSIISELEK